jgi:hypothetical protein
MSKNYLLIILLLLFAWSNLDKLPPEYQFWKNNQAWIKVQNNSDKDLKNVSVGVWSRQHRLGTIKQNMSQELMVLRRRDASPVLIRFNYGNEELERYAGLLDEENNYQMVISVSIAGIVTAREAAPQEADEATKQRAPE